MKLRMISPDDVRAAVSMAEAIDAMREAFGQLSGHKADIPDRTAVSGDGGVMLLMPGHLRESGAMGSKLVSVFEDNPERGLPTVNALMVMVDATTGMPEAIVEAGYLTALRTGAASGLATDLLAVEDASVLTVFGAGTQARTQVEAVREVRPIEEVRIVSRTRESAEAFADELEAVETRVMDDRTEAVKGSRVICTATTSDKPVFAGEDVEPGTHINGVGSYTPTTREVDDTLVDRARVVVDSMEAAMKEAGDIIVAVRRNVVSRAGLHGELGEIVNGRLEGRRNDEQITFFKSVGNASQDLAVARRVVTTAEDSDLGAVVEL